MRYIYVSQMYRHRDFSRGTQAVFAPRAREKATKLLDWNSVKRSRK